MIDISKLPKAKVLAALYNRSKQQGMGMMNPRGREPMTAKQAEEELERSTYFDYLRGRVMKVDLSEDSFSEFLYDRDNGEGAAQQAIDSIQ